jgi:hypothetical protein
MLRSIAQQVIASSPHLRNLRGIRTNDSVSQPDESDWLLVNHCLQRACFRPFWRETTRESYRGGTGTYYTSRGEIQAQYSPILDNRGFLGRNQIFSRITSRQHSAARGHSIQWSSLQLCHQVKLHTFELHIYEQISNGAWHHLTGNNDRLLLYCPHRHFQHIKETRNFELKFQTFCRL